MVRVVKKLSLLKNLAISEPSPIFGSSFKMLSGLYDIMLLLSQMYTVQVMSEATSMNYTARKNLN